MDSNAEEHIRGPFSRKYIARALVLLRVPQDNLLVRQNVNGPFFTLDCFPKLVAMMDEEQAATQEFSESVVKNLVIATVSLMKEQLKRNVEQERLCWWQNHLCRSLRAANVQLQLRFWYLKTSTGEIIVSILRNMFHHGL